MPFVEFAPPFTPRMMMWPSEGARWFRQGPVRVCVASEHGRWHMSVSCDGDRYPTWDEIADARYQLLPNDRDFGLILPPPADYVNIRNVFHLWELRDEGLPVERGVAMLRTHEDGSAAPC
jgi:hypothetical protein